MLKLLLYVIIIAVATYATIRLIQKNAEGSGSRPARRTPQLPQIKRPVRRPPPRPVAPDDDEDFLRDLDRKRRHPEDPEAS